MTTARRTFHSLRYRNYRLFFGGQIVSQTGSWMQRIALGWYVLQLTHSPFDVGVIHYASDTPYSRRQSLLSKSLSYFGVESTYGCTVAILQRILRNEILRHS